jgi:hypothetical protein
MSVPRPAMLVAMVTCAWRPAWAMMFASASWLIAFSTLCRTPVFLSSFETRSDFSTEVVPTSTGWPFSWHSLISCTTASNFSRSLL